MPPFPQAGVKEDIPTKTCLSEEPQLMIRQFGEEREMPLPAGILPFGGNIDKREQKAFDSRGRFKLCEDGTYSLEKCRKDVLANRHKYKEYCILIQERAWKVFPSEVIVELVKVPFTCAALVVNLNNLLFRMLPIVGQNGAIDIPAVKQIQLTVLYLGSLDNQSKGLLHSKRVIFNTCHIARLIIDVSVLPVFYSPDLDVLVLRLHSPYIEHLAVSIDQLHHILAIRTAVGTELTYRDLLIIQQLEYAG